MDFGEGSLEGVVTMTSLFSTAFADKRVLLTGHTGFKGAWLAEWLLHLGAELTGYALPPPTQPSLFAAAGLAGRLRHIEADIGDRDHLVRVVKEGRFDFVFHLAAQPLVRASYVDPLGTFETNVLGTAKLLEAIRLAGAPCVAVVVTTDKCYENREWLHAYREEDPLGGYDPYSSSKAATELVVSSWRRSFFPAGSPVVLASARAGNVIGPGDWAADRIVPDCVRALQCGAVIPVRNKTSTRPWQHVLEPLGGYLSLAAQLAAAKQAGDQTRLAQLASAFNFGPALSSNHTVADLVVEVLKHWPGHWEDRSDPLAPHEAAKLNLAIDKAHHLLGWAPRWDFPATIQLTIQGYRHLVDGGPSAQALMQSQIAQYEATELNPS